MRLMGEMCTGLMPVRSPPIWLSPLRAMAMTTSSSEALPARSPMPLMVHSTWRAPAMAPARLLAVLSPRSFWQCVDMMAPSMPGVLALIAAMRLPNSCGRFQPVVSGMLSVVAPASMTAPRMRYRNSGSLRPASSGLNSMSVQPRLRRWRTAATAFSTTSSGVILSLNFMWISEVAMKVCTRGLAAPFTASHARSRSGNLVRERPQMTGTWPSGPGSLPTSTAICRTASKSSGDAMGKPASMMSTPRRDRLRAMSSFSLMVRVQPGDCSPSRRVVSKMRT
mmetsp:Transcript_11203/g.28732  ORF Transcript_11203/g.28732 Transcript_11203/m.28732 type:complete len:280 (+) Transcript_11203:934-1773(+)